MVSVAAEASQRAAAAGDPVVGGEAVQAFVPHLVGDLSPTMLRTGRRCVPRGQRSAVVVVVGSGEHLPPTVCVRRRDPTVTPWQDSRAKAVVHRCPVVVDASSQLLGSKHPTDVATVVVDAPSQPLRGRDAPPLLRQVSHGCWLPRLPRSPLALPSLATQRAAPFLLLRDLRRLLCDGTSVRLGACPCLHVCPCRRAPADDLEIGGSRRLRVLCVGVR